jgi:hypothetical protein
VGIIFNKHLKVLGILFGLLAILALRMKFIWIPIMCILASIFISDYAQYGDIIKSLVLKFFLIKLVILY